MLEKEYQKKLERNLLDEISKCRACSKNPRDFTKENEFLQRMRDNFDAYGGKDPIQKGNGVPFSQRVNIDKPIYKDKWYNIKDET